MHPTRPSSSEDISSSTSTQSHHEVTVQFEDVTAHTAKCDECDQRNQDGMVRCLACGWQCCKKCLNARGDDRSHHTFSNTHVPE